MTGSGWSEDKNWPRSEWQADVSNGDTQLGYWDWVEHNQESATVTAPELNDDGELTEDDREFQP